jgi:hypothetical protein
VCNRKEKQEREAEVTSRFCLVALSGFEPELWLRSRLRVWLLVVRRLKGVEKGARLEHGALERWAKVSLSSGT